MSKKQTTNTFGKGMMLDLHPLTVPSDVLTDALNATTITMNGNEGILQNDMGNGRVESAFLPPGYVPVGIKEYGGIIYVASYNPVTNKSQIGSFPSPERNIDQTEEGQLDNPLELLNTQYKRNYKFNEFNTYGDGSLQIGLGGLTNKVEIFGDYKVIRSGDKFGFYFGNSQDNKDLLSNYFSFIDKNNRAGNSGNTSINDVGGWDEENKVYQNNIITLSTQVLDSNNNLRDLTHQLKRYDTQSKPIKFIDESEDDRFNAGYFIGKPNNDWDPVNQERNKKALNTYNNKLFGRLYLVGQVNVVDHIDVQLVTKSYADKSLVAFDEKLKGYTKSNILYFYIDYYYNFPLQYLEKPVLYIYYDNTFKSATGIFERFSDETLSTYKINSYQGNITIEQCNKDINSERPGIDDSCRQIQQESSEEYNKIINYQNNGGVKIATVSSDNYDNIDVIVIPNNIESPTYDPITNLYRKRYIAYIVLNEEEYSIYNNGNLKNNTILNYIIIPQMQNVPGETSPSKLTHIAYEGSIDLSKIGSGECNITTWRYICTDNMVKLNWGLEDYPLDTDVIEDMRMDFYDWNDRTTLIKDQDESILQHPSMNWYLMFNQISYNSVNTSITFGDDTLKKRHIYLVKLSRKKNGNYESIGWRILITTPIYNELFMTHNDYCSDEAKDDIDEKNKINIGINISVESNSKENSSNTTQIHKLENGQYNLFDDFSTIRTEPDTSNYSYINYTNFSTTKNLKVELNIPEIYPFEINDDKKITYSIDYNSNVIKNILNSIVGSDTLPIIDNINNIIGLEAEQDWSIVNHQENSFSGNSYITIKNVYKIPSQALYTYDTLATITANYKYRTMYDFLFDNLRTDLILFPFMGGVSTGSNYFNLFVYNCSTQEMSHHIRKDIFKYTGKGKNVKYLSQGLNKIDEILQGCGLSDNKIIIIGSPLTFGWSDWGDNNDSTITGDDISEKIINNKINPYIREYNNNTDSDENIDEFGTPFGGNFMLRRDKYPYGINNITNQPIYHRLNNDSAQYNTDYKWFEKGDDNTFQDGKRTWGHKDWFMLLWRNKDGNLTIVDKFYAFNNEYILQQGFEAAKNTKTNYDGYFKDEMKGVSQLESSVLGDRIARGDWIIDKIFGLDYSQNVFYKTTEQDLFDGYPIKITSYNTDYNVEITDSIGLQDISFGEELLKYFDTTNNKIVRQERLDDNIDSYNGLILTICDSEDEDSEEKLGNTEDINSLKEYLDFKLEAVNPPQVFDTSVYNISGMSDFINNVSIEGKCEGCIRKDNKIYTIDSRGLNIVGDIYVIEEGKGPVISNLVSKNRLFLNSLIVKNNDLLISNYDTDRSKHYAFSLSDRVVTNLYSTELVVKIDLPHVQYLDCKDDETIQHVNLIFGDEGV